MGATTPLIRSVSAPANGDVCIEASDGNRYSASLLSLAGVYCFPRDLSEWSKVSIDSYGLALVWVCRFEVHVDQIIGLASHVDKITPTDRPPAQDNSRA